MEYQDSLTIEDAARLLGRSQRTVHRHVKRLGVQVEHVYQLRGRQVRIKRADVDRIAQDLADRVSAMMPKEGAVSDTGNGVAKGGNGHAAGVVSDTAPTSTEDLGALPDAALDQLASTIRQAVAQGVQDGLLDAQGLLPPPRPSRGLQRLQSVAYVVLVGVLLFCGVAAWSMLQRAQDLVR